ncbi:MAG TPA: hypothetical protein VJT71_07860 [Pyrinomonadaceae bacterium]|nr:hypothetical protein [Pyrinomonadaceae bacterium]
MNNKKCPNCGFINFVNAEVCRKCETVLNPPEGIEEYADSTGYRSGYASGYGSGYGSQRYALAPQKTKIPTAKILGVAFVLVLISVVGAGILAFKMRIRWTMLQPDGSTMIFWMPGPYTNVDEPPTPTAIGMMSKRMSSTVIPGQGSANLVVVNFSRGFPAGMPTEKVLEGELNNFLENTGSKLVSKNFTSVHGAKALEFETIPPNSEGSRGYGKLILGSSRLYVALITAKENSSLLRQKDKFLNPETMVSGFN